MTAPLASTGPRFVFAGRLARLWWVRLPRLGRRWSPSLGATMADGVYLGAIRVLGALATPAAVVVGYLAASHQWGYRAVPTESAGLLLLMVAIGAASAQLGGAFLVGFVASDFFAMHEVWSYPQRIQAAQEYWPGERHLAYFARERVPLLILYLVFAVALMKLPVITRRLLRPFLPGNRGRFALSAAMSFTGMVLVTFVTVYLWAQIAAVLVRPLYTWRGIDPLERVIAPLQQDAALLGRVAALVAGARIVVQALTVLRPHLATRADLLELELLQPLRHRSVASRVPRVIRAVVPAALMTLLLSGFYAGRSDAAIVFAALLAVGLVQQGVVRVPLGAWGRMISRVPVALRLAAVVGVTYGYAVWISVDRVREQESFRPLLVGLAVSATVLVLLFPRRAVPAPPTSLEGGGPDAP
jgi:hypothetical protein